MRIAIGNNLHLLVDPHSQRAPCAQVSTDDQCYRTAFQKELDQASDRLRMAGCCYRRAEHTHVGSAVFANRRSQVALARACLLKSRSHRHMTLRCIGVHNKKNVWLQ